MGAERSGGIREGAGIARWRPDIPGQRAESTASDSFPASRKVPD